MFQTLQVYEFLKAVTVSSPKNISAQQQGKTGGGGASQSLGFLGFGKHVINRLCPQEILTSQVRKKGEWRGNRTESTSVEDLMVRQLAWFHGSTVN